MLGAIPNPKKSLTIDFPISKLKETIIFIPLNNFILISFFHSKTFKNSLFSAIKTNLNIIDSFLKNSK